MHDTPGQKKQSQKKNHVQKYYNLDQTVTEEPKDRYFISYAAETNTTKPAKPAKQCAIRLFH